MKSTAVFGGLLVAAFLSVARLAAQEQVKVTHTSDAVRVDGVLDDDAWKTAADLGALTQREPREGTVPSEPTHVRLLVDANFLYVGILNRDADPDAIVRSQMTRDADLSQNGTNRLARSSFGECRLRNCKRRVEALIDELSKKWRTDGGTVSLSPAGLRLSSHDRSGT